MTELSIILTALGTAGLTALIMRRKTDPDSTDLARVIREELHRTSQSMSGDLERFGKMQMGFSKNSAEQAGRLLEMTGQQLQQLTAVFDKKTEQIKSAVESRLVSIQKDNHSQLEAMRQTVDEKLQSTLEKRLGESFRVVNRSLESVQRGLGEMQTLATGVGDLKRVLSNVKTKGILGEYQLASILEEVLSPEQYKSNVKTNPDLGGYVEFAIRIPDKNGDGSIWLPIDSKFPLDSYERLIEAEQAAQVKEVTQRRRELATAVKAAARDISAKYLAPPYTTDFGILFLPVEGLYAEVMRDPDLFRFIQNEYKITVAGPANLSVLLNSLQMGFRTLAIQKRTSEIWEAVGVVKTEFGKFGTVLDKVHKKLQESTNVVKEAQRRNRVLTKKLDTVQSLPQENDQLTEPPRANASPNPIQPSSSQNQAAQAPQAPPSHQAKSASASLKKDGEDGERQLRIV